MSSSVPQFFPTSFVRSLTSKSLLSLSREPDPSLVEPLCALIHASPRTELRELHALREMLMSKYGRNFAENAMENKDNCVGERTMSKLKIETPPKELVDAYISESESSQDRREELRNWTQELSFQKRQIDSRALC